MMAKHELADVLKQQTEHSLDEFLQPISEDKPAGESLLYSQVYQTIKSARRADDPSVPRSEWETTLKQAEWDKVSQVAGEALVNQSKDLQVAMWLLEAQVHRYGFFGLAPTLMLIEQLCAEFWSNLFPELDNDGNEFRQNLFVWMNEKLLPVLYIQNLGGDEHRKVTWEDFEIAVRHEQLKESHQKVAEDEGISLQECQRIFVATPSNQLAETSNAVEWALAVIDQLLTTLNELWGKDTPSLGQLVEFLEDVGDFIASELKKRGHGGNGVHQVQATAEREENLRDVTGDERPMTSAVLQDRNFAYAQLQEIADFLEQVEPHSPVPYMLRRMVDWGRMSTSDLYQQLFIQSNGQIDIFEVLGLQRSPV